MHTLNYAQDKTDIQNIHRDSRTASVKNKERKLYGGYDRKKRCTMSMNVYLPCLITRKTITTASVSYALHRLAWLDERDEVANQIAHESDSFTRFLTSRVVTSSENPTVSNASTTPPSHTSSSTIKVLRGAGQEYMKRAEPERQHERKIERGRRKQMNRSITTHTDRQTRRADTQTHIHIDI